MLDGRRPPRAFLPSGNAQSVGGRSRLRLARPFRRGIRIGGMSDVLIGQAYHLRFDPKLWDAMEPYPPLGALYAAAVLRGQGWDVSLHDSMLATSEDEWRSEERRVGKEWRARGWRERG